MKEWLPRVCILYTGPFHLPVYLTFDVLFLFKKCCSIELTAITVIDIYSKYIQKDVYTPGGGPLGVIGRTMATKA